MGCLFFGTDFSGEATEGGNTEGEGEGGQNGRLRRPNNRRRNFRGPRKPRTSENNAEGGPIEGGEGNENGQQKGARPPRRRFNRKPKPGGNNQVSNNQTRTLVILAFGFLITHSSIFYVFRTVVKKYKIPSPRVKRKHF